MRPIKFRLPRGSRLKILLLSLTAVFIGLITLTLGYFTTNGSCTIACHSMRPQAESLSRSAHSEIQCMACHAPPGGALALTMEHVVASRFVPMEFFLGFHKPINSHSEVSTHIEDERCYRCHAPGSRNFTPSKGLIMNQSAHLKHLDAGLHCTTCHNRVAHSAMDDPAAGIKYDKGKKGDFKYSNFMTMQEGCWRCHSVSDPYKSKKNGAVAPVECKTCHTKEWNLRPDYHSTLEGRTWQQRHGKIAKKDMALCSKCHESSGTIGAKTGIKTCYSCHQIVIPHDVETKDMSKNWKRTHYLQKNRDLCLKCHKENSAARKDAAEQKDPDFCHKCHHRDFAKEAKNLGIDDASTTRWKAFHFKVVKGAGAEKCFACHKPTFCAGCHVSAKKPQPGSQTKFNKKYWSGDSSVWQTNDH